MVNMATAKIKELASIVAKLQNERQSHEDAIAEIDAAFEEMGIAPGPVRRRGKKPGPKPGSKRGGKKKTAGRKKKSTKRKYVKKKTGKKKTAKKTSAKKRTGKRKGNTGKRYAESGTAMVMRLVQQAGANGISGAELDKQWKKQGRAGGVYNILGALGKDGKVKKKSVKGQRGSTYTAA
jgi:hypothetical protein